MVGRETPIYRKKQPHVGRQPPQLARVGEENRKAELKDMLQWHLITRVVKKCDWGNKYSVRHSLNLLEY